MSQIKDEDKSMVFSLGKNTSGQKVKIDFKNYELNKKSKNPFTKNQVAKKPLDDDIISTSDLKSSCLSLIN